MARRDLIWRGAARRGTAGSGMGNRCVDGIHSGFESRARAQGWGKARHATAWHGKARPGGKRLGLARPDMAGRYMAGHGTARLGVAGHGKARQGSKTRFTPGPAMV